MLKEKEQNKKKTKRTLSLVQNLVGGPILLKAFLRAKYAVLDAKFETSRALQCPCFLVTVSAKALVLRSLGCHGGSIWKIRGFDIKLHLAGNESPALKVIFGAYIQQTTQLGLLEDRHRIITDCEDW